MSGALTIDTDGRVRGPVAISYNDPWPCVNGTPGGSARAMNGLVLHTMVGNLPGTIAVFNDPAYQASAYFGIDQQGNVHQFGPIGKDWEAWAQVAGNSTWYSMEMADNGDPHNPMTPPQLYAGAQILEVLSRFAGFPMELCDSVGGHGLGVHYMGGQAWGGHTCPDPGDGTHTRSGQRPQMLAIAHRIRNPKPVPPVTPTRIAAPGGVSWAHLAERYGLVGTDLIWQTARHDDAGWGVLQAEAVAKGVTADVPHGTIVWVGRAGQS